MSLRELVLDTESMGCKSIQISAITAPPHFGNTVTFGDAGATATFMIDQATFDEATCSIDTAWMGYLQTSNVALIKVVTDKGVNRVVPWRLQNKGSTCPAPTSGPAYSCFAMQGLQSDSFYTCE
jgi:hypothetical protein